MLKAEGLLFIALCAISAASAAPASGPVQKMPTENRDLLPPALRNVPLNRLSSGALMLLNHDDLVQPPAAWFSQRATSAQSIQALVALDPRVGANIRLGDDPATLPSNMRAQAEPHIARSPVDPDFLVATFQEGRFTNGGAVDCGYSISTDGGLTWTRALIPNLTPASGGSYFRATDPVAGVDLNGRVYLNTEGATDSAFNHGAILVSRSIDGGQTFGNPVVVHQPANTSLFPDKPWMTINTFTGTSTVGRILVTFSLFGTGGPSGAPIYRSFSDNSGTSWSSIAQIGTSTNTQGSQPVFLPNGNVVIVYWNFGTAADSAERLEAVISTTGGNTFGTAKLIAHASEYNESSIRSGGFLPSAVANRTNSNIYVVYQTILSGSPRIAFTKSTDGGNTWSAPIAISDNPAGLGVFNPAINTSPDGQTLTVVYYDHRNNPVSDVLVDLYLAQSFDGGTTWQPNIRLSSVSTDASLAPLTASGYMLGDYQGVAETTNANVPAVPVWIDTRTGNPDPFVTRVGIAPQVDFTSWEAARLSLQQINNPALGGQGGDADTDGEDNSSEFQSMTDPNNPNSVVRTARQLNVSTRLNVLTGANVGIGGFIIGGANPKKVLLRAIGPSLSQANVANALQDPTLELHNQAGTVIASNDDWRVPLQNQTDVEATGTQPADDRESALVQTLAPGGYTAVVQGKDGNTGVALVEIYDADPSTSSTLANLSTRGFVDVGDNVMIGGEILGHGLGVNGAGSAQILVRAIGPSLAQQSVPNPLQDPVLELHNGNGTLIAANDNWQDTQQAAIQATGAAPTDPRESAILAVLTQGGYTAILSGKNGTTGVALVEAYKVQ